MIQSHVIEVDGTFVGTAVRHGTEFRFVAIDGRLGDLNGSVTASVADMHRRAAAALDAKADQP